MKPRIEWRAYLNPNGPKVSSWCLAYKIGLAAVIVGLVAICVSTALAMLAFDWQQDGKSMPQWMKSLAGMGAGAWHARHSGFGEVADLYYTCILPVFPAAVVATYVFSTYEADGTLNYWITRRQDKKGILARCISVVLFPSIGILFLKIFSGSDARLLNITGEPSALLLRGWIPFAALGALTAFGPRALRILISQKQ